MATKPPLFPADMMTDHSARMTPRQGKAQVVIFMVILLLFPIIPVLLSGIQIDLSLCCEGIILMRKKPGETIDSVLIPYITDLQKSPDTMEPSDDKEERSPDRKPATNVYFPVNDPYQEPMPASFVFEPASLSSADCTEEAPMVICFVPADKTGQLQTGMVASFLFQKDQSNRVCTGRIGKITGILVMSGLRPFKVVICSLDHPSCRNIEEEKLLPGKGMKLTAHFKVARKSLISILTEAKTFPDNQEKPI